MNYKILLTGNIQRNDGVVIPVDLANSDYQKYQTWLSAGNSAEVETPPIPTAEEAWALGAAYISGFFTADQRQMLTAKMILGSTAQKALITEIFSWITLLEQAATSQPVTFDPTTFGEPPHSYAAVLGATGI